MAVESMHNGVDDEFRDPQRRKGNEGDNQAEAQPQGDDRWPGLPDNPKHRRQISQRQRRSRHPSQRFFLSPIYLFPAFPWANLRKCAQIRPSKDAEMLVGVLRSNCGLGTRDSRKSARARKKESFTRGSERPREEFHWQAHKPTFCG